MLCALDLQRSVSAHLPLSRVVAYSAAKAAVLNLTQFLAREWAPERINVNAVCPGYTDTDIVRDAIANIMRKTGRSEADALASLVRSAVAGQPRTALAPAASVVEEISKRHQGGDRTSRDE